MHFVPDLVKAVASVYRQDLVSVNYEPVLRQGLDGKFRELVVLYAQSFDDAAGYARVSLSGRKSGHREEES